MSAFNEGIEAYGNGDDPEKNPYSEYDAQFDEWEDGFYSIAAECETEKHLKQNKEPAS